MQQRPGALLVGPDGESAQWVAQATRLLLQAGAASVDVAVTHALIDADALAALHAAGVGQFWSTDCVAHPTNTVPMATELARGVEQVFSVSGL